jgi:hypothetical protein
MAQGDRRMDEIDDIVRLSVGGITTHFYRRNIGLGIYRRNIGLGTNRATKVSRGTGSRAATRQPTTAAKPQQHGATPQQRGGQEKGVGGGHIPQHGPRPVKIPRFQPQQQIQQKPRPPQQGEQRRNYKDQPGHPEVPHVHAQNEGWVGQDTGRNDPHYHLDHPWEHGHFTGPIGPPHVWRLHGLCQ